MAYIDRYSDEYIDFHHSFDNSPFSYNFVMHVHDMYEIYCFISGSVKYNIEGTIYTPEPGSILLIRSAESHRLILDNNDPYERFAVHFSPNLISKMFSNDTLLAPFIDRPLGQMNLYKPSELGSIKPCDLFASMSALNTPISRHDMIISGIIGLLYTLAPAFQHKKHRTFDDAASLSREIIWFINTNLSENLSVQRLCKEFHMSESQLRRVFYASTGAPIASYILSKRLIAARQLMTSGETAQNVCRKCGFGDYSSFYRAFVKRFGYPPSHSDKY